MLNHGTLLDPRSSHLPGISGGKYSRLSIVFVQRADQTKCDGRMVNKDGRINQRGPGGGQHVD